MNQVRGYGLRDYELLELERDQLRAEVERLKAEKQELLAAVKELTRKGESLCHQSGQLLVQEHDLKAAVTRLKAEKQELLDALGDVVKDVRQLNGICQYRTWEEARALVAKARAVVTKYRSGG